MKQADIIKTTVRDIPEQAAEIVAETKRAITAECSEILPGYCADIQLGHYVAEAMLAARKAVADDTARRAGLADDLAGVRADIAAHRAEVDAIHTSGDRSDIAAGRVGLLLRDIEGLRNREAALVADLSQPVLNASAEEAAWVREVGAARGKALAEVCAELEARLLRAAGEAGREQSRLAQGGIGFRWRPTAALRSICATGMA